jgi:Xaa-Pro aminopeptidase
VTPDGCELLTRDVPVKADEIEALMQEALAAAGAAREA